MPFLHRSFSAKEPSCSFVKNDLQLNASYESSPPCTTDRCLTHIQDAMHRENTHISRGHISRGHIPRGHISRGVLEIVALDSIDESCCTQNTCTGHHCNTHARVTICYWCHDHVCWNGELQWCPIHVLCVSLWYNDVS